MCVWIVTNVILKLEAAVHTHNIGAKITSVTLVDWDWPRLRVTTASHCLILSSLAVYYVKYRLPSHGFYLVHFYTWYNYCFCEDCVSELPSVEGLWLTFDGVEMISCVQPGSVSLWRSNVFASFSFLFYFFLLFSFFLSFFLSFLPPAFFLYSSVLCTIVRWK